MDGVLRAVVEGWGWDVTVVRRWRSRDGSEATTTLKTFEDPEQGLHVVARSLPAGMDIAPDVWRFEHVADALNQFGVVVKSLQSRGFIELGEPDKDRDGAMGMCSDLGID